MAAVLVTVVLIDAADLLRTKLAAVVFLAFVVAHVFEALFQNLGQWLTDVHDEQVREALNDDSTLKGPMPSPEPEAPAVAEPPAPEQPSPSASPPPKQEPDWERLAKEPAYKLKHPALGSKLAVPG